MPNATLWALLVAQLAAGALAAAWAPPTFAAYDDAACSRRLSREACDIMEVDVTAPAASAGIELAADCPLDPARSLYATHEAYKVELPSGYWKCGLCDAPAGGKQFRSEFHLDWHLQRAHAGNITSGGLCAADLCGILGCPSLSVVEPDALTPVVESFIPQDDDAEDTSPQPQQQRYEAVDVPRGWLRHRRRGEHVHVTAAMSQLTPTQRRYAGACARMIAACLPNMSRHDGGQVEVVNGSMLRRAQLLTPQQRVEALRSSLIAELCTIDSSMEQAHKRKQRARAGRANVRMWAVAARIGAWLLLIVGSIAVGVYACMWVAEGGDTRRRRERWPGSAARVQQLLAETGRAEPPMVAFSARQSGMTDAAAAREDDLQPAVVQHAAGGVRLRRGGGAVAGSASVGAT